MCPFQRCTASISNLVHLSRFLTPSFSVYTKLLLEWKYPGFNELGDMDAPQCWIWGESVAFYEKKNHLTLRAACDADPSPSM